MTDQPKTTTAIEQHSVKVPPPDVKPRTFRDHAEEIAWTLRSINPKVRRSS